MKRKTSRRQFLTGALAGAGASFALPALRRANAAGGKITIGTEAGSPYDAFYRKHAGEFTAATGVAVNFNAIPHDSIHQQFVQDALARAGGFDVYIADQVWLPEFYEKGFIADVSDQLGDADKADFSKTALQTVTYKGAEVALPIMVHNCAMYYRKDLLAAVGFSAPPANWDEYRKTAKATTKGGVWGTMILSKQGIEAATRLNSFYQQAGGDIVDANGHPTLDTDAGRAALEFMTAMVFAAKAAPEGVLELPDMQGAWLDGKLALAPVWPYLYPLSKKPLNDKFAIATAPGLKRPAGTVYSWGFAAATGAKDPKAAAAWVKWATASEQLYNFGKEFLNPVPRKTALDKINADPDIAAEDKAAIAAFAASAAAGLSMPMIPQYSQLLDVLGVMQSGVMSKAATIDAALKDGQARAEAIMRS
ncbi:MAG: extracellular solute-binding protein [Hyphomicrobiales bacterium]|nr:extracellular solute-binding protein [Hyphomicrobiales bacterium]